MKKLQYSKKVCLAPGHIVKLFRQPKFYLGFAISLPCGLLGASIKHFDLDAEGGLFHGVINDTAAYSGLTILVVFLLQFRVSSAYSKFAVGTELVYNVFGDLLDTASSLIAFCEGAKASTQDVDDFLHLLVRLVSLLNASILADLQFDPYSDEPPPAYSFHIIDVQGLSEKSLKVLAHTDMRVEMVLQWLQQAIVRANQKEVFGVPPPILTRALQDLGSAMVNFHKALRITEVPFPFPYKVALQLLLITHFCVTPIVTAQWTDLAVWTAGFCIIATFAPWFFMGLAMELDQPYGCTVNSLDLGSLQVHLNQRLLTCLLTFQMHDVTLSENVTRDIADLLALSPGGTSPPGISYVKSFQSSQQEVKHTSFPSRDLMAESTKRSESLSKSKRPIELPLEELEL